jgi:hypothetical protein
MASGQPDRDVPPDEPRPACHQHAHRRPIIAFSERSSSFAVIPPPGLGRWQYSMSTALPGDW